MLDDVFHLLRTPCYVLRQRRIGAKHPQHMIALLYLPHARARALGDDVNLFRRRFDRVRGDNRGRRGTGPVNRLCPSRGSQQRQAQCGNDEWAHEGILL
ncbi:hypothetical protein GCM10009094_15920 [Massilia aurea]